MQQPAKARLMLPPPPEGGWAWLVVNSSGGKDSQTALRLAVESADASGYPRSSIVVSHQDLGRSEWDGVGDLVRAQAAHYGLRLEISRYRDKAGNETSLLDYARRRGKWPDNKNRWCTSEFKRGPGGRVLTQLRRERPGHVLSVFGFRGEESPARAKRKPFAVNPRFSRQDSEIWDWLPAHSMSTLEVWESIRESGVPHHAAYDLGMPRLSCVFCIFATEEALLLAGRHNRALLDEYCAAEEAMGHDFQNGLSLRHIREQLDGGRTADLSKIKSWRM